MGFCEVWTIVFVVLKLVGIISWSWWLVLLPEIVSVVLSILFILGVAKLDRENPFWRWRL